MALCQGGKPLKISFGADGERDVYFRDAASPGELGEAIGTSGTAVEVTPSTDPSKVVVIHDKKTGLVAEHPLKDLLAAGSWTLKPEDYKRVFQVNIKVFQGEGKPVASGNVMLTAGADKRSNLLSPGDNGTVSFKNLPKGEVAVQVQYKAKDQTKTTAKQIFKGEIQDGKPLEFTITISDSVETVTKEETPEKGESDKPAAKDSKETSRPQGETGGFGTLVGLLLGLALLGGIGYGIYRYVKASPDQTKEILSKVGLQPVDPAASASPVAAPDPPKPLQKIVLDDSAPTSLGTPAPVFGAPAVKNPRLVLADGNVLLLQDGSSEVGRDASKAIAFASESSVSRTHAVLRRSGDDVFVADAGSTNGTFVNGARLSSETLLQPGDVVMFGSITCRFEV